ncbi:MAG: enoyl-CoA hydratase/isomerase family protein [Rhizobiales bacterium]|nr:enoyl-CoA hydratase/isomerase family protein [Hyphomicrobiales bacterium]
MQDITSSTPDLRAYVTGNTGFLILNRPDRRNAVTAAMWAGMPEIMTRLAAEPNVRVVLITGAGEEAFASGADITEFARNRGDASQARAYEARNEAALASIRGAGLPVIAMIHGFCIGGGLAIALACDLRIAAETAVFALPPAKLGLAYPLSGLRDLLGAVSTATAKDLLFTGRRVAADEALRLGLVNRVVEASNLAATADAICAEIGGNAPLSLLAAKRAVAAISATTIPQEQVDELSLLSDACFSSADYTEGRQAFLEKRKPNFRGI